MIPLARRFLAAGLLLSTALFATVSRADQTAAQVYSDAVETYKRGDVESAKRQLQLALEIDKNFRPASTLLGRIVADQRGGHASGMTLKSLQTTVVPVEFKDASLTTALEFLRQRTDEATGGKLKINFAVNLPPDLANKHVTLKLERVPVMEVLRYIGELSGVSFQVQKFAILVTPAVPAAAPVPVASPAL